MIFGRLFRDLREESVDVGRSQRFTMPRGVEHRARALEPTTMLIMAAADVEPTGDERQAATNAESPSQRPRLGFRGVPCGRD